MNSDLTEEECRKLSLDDGSTCLTSDGSCPINRIEMHGTEAICEVVDGNFVDASLTRLKKPRLMNRMDQQVDVPETSGKTCEQPREDDQGCYAELNTVSSLSTEKSCKEKTVASDAEGSIDVSPAVNNGQDCLTESSLSLVAASPTTLLRKKLIVLDINGLLADVVFPIPKDYEATTTIAGRAVFKRPYCDDFLRFCFERFEVAIWSSRTRKNVDKLIDILMGDLRSKLLFCWDASYCTVTEFKTTENKHKPLVFKELRKLWEKRDPELPERSLEYNKSNTLLIDDSPHKALLNPPHTAIFPKSYKFTDENDNSLGDGGDLKAYLERLCIAENVQEFVEQTSFGQTAITEGNPNWSFYLEVMATCAPPDSTLVVHQEKQRMNQDKDRVLVSNDSGFGRERKLVRMDKALIRSPPRVDRALQVGRALKSPPRVDKALRSPPREDRALRSPLQVDRALKSPPRVDRALRSPPQLDKALRSPPWAHRGHWTPPPRGHLKLNTKGSVRARGQSAAAGGLIRDEYGNWRGGFAVNIGATDWLTTELVGLLEGLRLVRQDRVLGAVVEMDSDAALHLIRSSGSGGAYDALVRDCRHLLEQCCIFRICHTRREGNRCADSLANYGHSLPCHVTYFRQPPYWLNHQQYEDKRGVKRHRQ